MGRIISEFFMIYLNNARHTYFFREIVGVNRLVSEFGQISNENSQNFLKAEGFLKNLCFKPPTQFHKSQQKITPAKLSYFPK